MRGEASWTVPADHSAFAGHFPGAPIVPGVVLLDEAVRAVESACGIALLPGQISAAKFLRPVGPGETLLIRYEVDVAAVRIEILSGEHRVASATFIGRAKAGAPP